MKNCYLFFLLFLFGTVSAQIKLELTPQGFASQNIPRPQVLDEKLMESVRNWVATYNEKNEYGYDISDVSSNGMTIDAYKRNAFYYTNKGEVFQHRIRYRMRLDFTNQTIKVQFSVTEIYAQKNLLTLKISDFFLPDGRLKEDYRDAKPSLEKTTNAILNNFAEFMARV
ncbi:hypothetical protein [Flavobacterium sp.]|uniref:hypothetical protein n=1 Tax=Flavobacterium sp. TaxID=239 RepID=UPI00120771D2|nr:hypothetical protein [Flavobacterium sp.]RZJ71813.1 MAG: hypothetical protein EOO49_09105 [Flavobacterium sp.]